MGTKRVATMGILLSLVMVLSVLEHLFIMPFMPPHVKPGLANIIIMYCVFVMGGPSAVLLVFMKGLFVLVTRGAVAGLLSMCGGLLSVGVMIALAAVSARRLGYGLISVCGAVAFNIGQLAVAAFWMATGQLLVFYFPLLLVSGIVAGLLTGALLKIVLPLLEKLPPGEVRH